MCIGFELADKDIFTVFHSSSIKKKLSLGAFYRLTIRFQICNIYRDYEVRKKKELYQICYEVDKQKASKALFLMAAACTVWLRHDHLAEEERDGVSSSS